MSPVLSLHHTHLFASDVDRSIASWRDHFGAVVVLDTVFAGARNVFMRIGDGRLHLYDQAPKHAGQVPRSLVDAGYFATLRREDDSRRSTGGPRVPDGA